LTSCYTHFPFKLTLKFCFYISGDAQYEEYIEHFNFMGKAAEFQEVELNPSDKVVVESTNKRAKSIPAKEVVLSLLNCKEFSECKFRFMQKDRKGRLNLCQYLAF